MTTSLQNLTLRVAADSWRGDPEFVVAVDGQQVGAVQTTSASHAQGHWQDVTLTGNFGVNPSRVSVSFVNDAWGGTASTDRNLYVQSLALNGATYLGSALAPALGPAEPDSAAMDKGGTITFATAPPNTLTLRVAADSWKGDPQFVVAVDGRQVGAVRTTSASHAQGHWQDVTLTGNFGVNPSRVSVSFVNDAWGGTASTDRNLYVQSLTLNGATYLGSALAPALGPAEPDSAAMDRGGTITFNTAAASVRPPPAVPGPSPTIDRNLPAEHVTALTIAGDNAIDLIEGRSGVSVTGTLSAPLATSDKLVVSVGDTTKVVSASDMHGNAFSFISGVPANGWASGNATAHVEDAAGNAGTSLAQAYTVAPAPTEKPAATGKMDMLGVNLSGGEYTADKLPGVSGTDYTYPTKGEIDYFASKGLNVVRLPFLWERLQPTQDGPLNQTVLAALDDVVKYANGQGMKVILDPHNYGSGYGNLIGSTGTPTSAFADFWGKLASHYASNGDVMFGLMNEPQVATATAWLADSNAAIQAIRGSGATSQEVLVPGAYYDGGSTWTTTDNASVFKDGIKDPNNNYAFEVHQYLDADGSGTSANVVSPTIGESRLAAVTQWAETNGKKLFLGEFGAAQDSNSLTAMDNMLSFMSQHSDVWQGATEWAAGPWLGNNLFTVEPEGLGTGSVVDKPQIGVLQRYAPGK